MNNRNGSSFRPQSFGPEAGFFGPGSEAWNVLGRRSVIMGGMRALLMHATHPAIAAATAQTARYEQDPWGRHRETLQLLFTLIFGTRGEATRAARQINATHRLVRGRDLATGSPYAATDPNLMVWVHASLVSSFLKYEQLTVGSLDDSARQRFCTELAFMASLLGLPSGRVTSTVDGLETYIDETAASGVLRSTDGSRQLAAIIQRPAAGFDRVRLRTAAFLAFHTLPVPIRELYGIRHGPGDERRLAALSFALRLGLRAVPTRARFLPCALAAAARTRTEPTGGMPTRRRRSGFDAGQSVH